MSVLRKFATAAMVVFLMVAGGVTASADTESTNPQAVQTCYGGAVQVSGSGTRFPSSGYYRTTSRCADINFRYGLGPSFVMARVCFRSTGACNKYRQIPRGTDWRLVATDVLDGTDFYMQFNRSYNMRVGRLAF
ncbi:hypothetical protein TL08_19340 [Actinoalloteichus hymeniacidonis]|uniref:Beta/Gamma crystallin n=2 Tax=Actinoalloteichus hymeniacidonis TaxID=340345 RepID=A0AAC9HSR9_9PSEU|nr:hypothetical protein TL08_19340 [Actinoalloteichus hymeniacidonis]